MFTLIYNVLHLTAADVAVVGICLGVAVWDMSVDSIPNASALPLPSGTWSSAPSLFWRALLQQQGSNHLHYLRC